MGTYYTEGARKTDIINEILNDLKPVSYHPFTMCGGGKCVINPLRTCQRLEHRTVGNQLWVLMAIQDWVPLEITGPNGLEIVPGDAKARQVTVLLYLLTSHRGSWGYKPMDESVGPYYYNCPKNWIHQLTTPPNDFARAWRIKNFGTEMSRTPAELTSAAADMTAAG